MSRLIHSAAQRTARVWVGSRISLASLLFSLIAAPGFADDDPQPPSPSGALALERAWPEHPEWAAMLADIVVKGSDISGDDGWFRKARSQSRFGWEATRAAWDRDADGSVSQAEFAGASADFARLDRNRDGVMTAADFDFSAPPNPSASVLFRRADRNGDSKVTRAELQALFAELDSGGFGFLSLADLQQAFAPPSDIPRDRASPTDEPTRLTFLSSFFRQELGAFPSGPNLHDAAPDFSLRTVDGGQEITLSKLIGPKPVVLIFGNFTCGPFRGQAGNLEKLRRRYETRASFVMVYVREAHPTDGWRMEKNDRAGIAIQQPRTYQERVGVARTCSRIMGLGMPLLVDSLDDAVNNRYSGIPSRFYLIDQAGKIAFKSGRGPFGFKPEEMEHSLLLLLRESSAAAQAGAAPKR